MSMNNLQKNIASEMQIVANALLALQPRMAWIADMYVNEGMTTLTNEDWQELTEFAHVTATDGNAAKNAFAAINTELGDGSAGTNQLYLLRIMNKVPG